MTNSGPGGTFDLADRSVPRIGYGMGQLARRTVETRDQSAALDLLRHAFDLGVRHFDTAEFYGHSLANALLTEAFGDLRDEVLLATKVGARSAPGEAIPLAPAQKPHELRAEVEANLTSLRTDRLDVVNLRRIDRAPGLIAQGDQIVSLDDQLAELVALRDQGKIIGIGLSHVTLDQFHAARSAGIACVQNIYHLLDRSDEPLLTACAEQEIAWIPYFPLGGGGAYAGLPRVADHPVVRVVADDLGATVSQVGLAWQLAHASNTMLIPGTGSTSHLIENTAAGRLILDPDTMDRLDAASAA